MLIMTDRGWMTIQGAFIPALPTPPMNHGFRNYQALGYPNYEAWLDDVNGRK